MLARLGGVIEISQVLHMAVHGRILGVGQCALDITYQVDRHGLRWAGTCAQTIYACVMCLNIEKKKKKKKLYASNR